LKKLEEIIIKNRYYGILKDFYNSLKMKKVEISLLKRINGE